MDRALLDLVPKRYLCPYCGEWHEWPFRCELAYYDFECDQIYCPNFSKIDGGSVSFHIENGDDDIFLCCNFYEASDQCDYVMQNADIAISKIIEHVNEPIVTFKVRLVFDEYPACASCYRVKKCNLAKLWNERDIGSDIEVMMGFEFDEEEYKKVSKEWMRHRIKQLEQANDSTKQTMKAHEDVITSKEHTHQQPTVKEKKEGTIMSGTSVWEWIYKRSPEENIAALKDAFSKYKDTLKWAIPAVTIYGAYRILKSPSSGITTSNVAQICKKNLDFSLDALKQNDNLMKLMAFGGVIATAYTVAKGTVAILNKDCDGALTVEQLEDGLSGMGKVANKFKKLQPMINDLLPVATSVVIVYIMTQKPEWIDVVKNKLTEFTGAFSSKLKVYSDIAKLFIADKLKLDLTNDEEVKKAKKFALLATVIGIGALLYGKRMLGKDAIVDEEFSKEKNEKLEAFFNTLVSALKAISPTAFSAIATILATKGVIKFTENGFISEEESESSDEEESVSAQKTTTGRKKPSGAKKPAGKKKPDGEKEQTTAQAEHISAEGTVE